MPVKPMTANEITATLLLEIPKRFSHIIVWRNNRIDAMAVGRNGVQRRVSAGIDGQGDICGIIGQSSVPGSFGGRMLQIEIKAGKDSMRPSQMAFRAMVERHQGVYIVVRSVEQCLNELEKICQQ